MASKKAKGICPDCGERVAEDRQLPSARCHYCAIVALEKKAGHGKTAAKE